MGRNGANGLVVLGAIYLAVGLVHYGAGLAVSPCREDRVSLSRSLFWLGSLNYEVLTGTSSAGDFLLSRGCRPAEVINPDRWNELIRQARGN